MRIQEHDIVAVRRRVVRVVDFESLAIHRRRFESRQEPLCEEVILLAYGTSAVLLRSFSTSKAGKSPLTFTVLVRRKTKPKNSINRQVISKCI